MPENYTLSVVMSVYNNSDHLEKTIDSILNQTHADFELIIINDGSTDNSQQILQTVAEKDSRIRLFQQPNNGLTNALIFGCEQATAKYIARHDVGDRSSADRFTKQLRYLESNRDCAVVFSQFRSVDKLDNIIHTYSPTENAFRSSIEIGDHDICAPSHHGCAMFRKACYSMAGGYRRQFYFTQDLDLWVRMSEYGKIHLIEEFLYDTLIATDTISGKFQPLQKQYHDIIIESAHRRREGKSDAGALARAEKIRPTTSVLRLNSNASNTLYFMASCLINTNPSLAKAYLKQALRKNPAHLKAWYKLLFKA